MYLSGKEGEMLIGASNLAGFTKGDLEYGAKTEIVTARSGGGAEETVEGVSGGTGNISITVDQEDMINGLVASGALVTLIFRHTSNGSIQATGQARLGKYKYTIDRNGTPQTVDIPFTCHKAWTFPT